MGFVIRFATTAASLWVAIWIVGGLTFDGSFWEFLIVTVLVGLANAFVKPLLKLFSLPLIILTMGLFLLIVNALVLQLVVWLAGPDVWDLGLESTGFFWATFWGAIVISIAGWLIGIILPDLD